MSDKQFYVYILANKNNNVLYIGVTSDLKKRVYEHKNKLAKGFTYKYNVDKLVYYEVAEEPLSAIAREKSLKKWNRKWKEKLIAEFNPTWQDLYNNI